MHKQTNHHACTSKKVKNGFISRSSAVSGPLLNHVSADRSMMSCKPKIGVSTDAPCCVGNRRPGCFSGFLLFCTRSQVFVIFAGSVVCQIFSISTLVSQKFPHKLLLQSFSSCSMHAAMLRCSSLCNVFHFHTDSVSWLSLVILRLLFLTEFGRDLVFRCVVATCCKPCCS